MGDKNKLSALRSELRKYKLSDLLIQINEESTDIFKNISNKFKGTKEIEVFLQDKKGFISKNKVLISAWWLVDLAYYSILYTNNNRNRIENKAQFYNAYIKLYNYVMSENSYEEWYKDKQYLLFPYVFVTGSEQFKYQTIGKIENNFCREMYILLEILPIVNNNIDVLGIVEKETSNNWIDIASWLLILSFLSPDHYRVDRIIDSFDSSNQEYKEKFSRLIRYYSLKIDDIRKPDTGKEILYTKPFVKITDDEVYCISPYLNYFAFEHCIYWIVRDYYQKKKSQDFVNAFGICFEKYVEELLEEYVPGNDYERIPETSYKTADWFIKLGDYEFFVEQKSSLAQIKLKNNKPSVEEIDKYLGKIVFEAIDQLKVTKEVYKKDDAFSVILIYDDYIYNSIMDCLSDFPKYKGVIDDSFLLMTISDFEKLLVTCSVDKTSFNGIIQNIINHDEYIGSSASMLKELESIKNEHILKNKYKKYIDLIVKNSVNLSCKINSNAFILPEIGNTL